ncbi:MAG: glycosyltransferase, partial [Alphaproteobacteria bacterium]|nr:glycosyltransferase [Alphaproteobacteria bacterium]
ASYASWFLPRRTPVIWSIHHSLVDIEHEKPLTQKVIRWSARVSRKASAIVYCSQVSARQHERLGFAPERTLVIPNGIDCDRFKPSEHGRRRLAERLGVPENGVLIGMLARHHPMKDFPNLIRAFADLVRRNVADLHLLLVGRDVTSQNGAVEGAVRETGVGDRVTLSEERNDLPDLLSGLDILAVSSAWGEAFPVIVGSAMASGVPAVVTDLGDCSWIVGDTGRVVPPRNVEALAAGLAALIHEGEGGRARLGAAARQRVLDNFSLKSFVERHRSLYNEVSG